MFIKRREITASVMSSSCREDTGLQQSSMKHGVHRDASHEIWLGSRDSSSDAEAPDDYIGNLSLGTTPPYACRKLNESSEKDTTNSLAPLPLMRTFGKTRRPWKAPGLKWEPNQSNEIPQSTGIGSKIVLAPVTYVPSRVTYTFVIITHCERLLKTTWLQFQLKKKSMSSTELQVPERVNELGMKPVFRLILKTPGPSGGADIEIRKTLSLMNFEEILTWPIYCVGSTDTRYLWRQKEVHDHYQLNDSGLLATCLLNNGTPCWTQSPWTP